MNFKYKNLDGEEEVVSSYTIVNGLVDVSTSDGGYASFYAEDVPKLINALQQAYDSLQQEKENK